MIFYVLFVVQVFWGWFLGVLFAACKVGFASDAYRGGFLLPDTGSRPGSGTFGRGNVQEIAMPVDLFSGILKTGDEVSNTTRDQTERIAQIFSLNGKQKDTLEFFPKVLPQTTQM